MSKDTDFIKSLTDNKTNPELGNLVRLHLIDKGLEAERVEYDPKHAHWALEAGIRQAFSDLGFDQEDPSTQDTPRRFASMFVGELTTGLNYDLFPKCTATPNGQDTGKQFDPGDGTRQPIKVGAYDQMVLVKDIQIMSLCEHHLQTIDGVAHIAYIPKTKVLGLSKFARVADFFARRPQIQERLTDQIYEALSFILETPDIGVVIDATHFCMRARGAMQANATTQTDKMGGRFLSHPSLRQEFLDAFRK